MIYKAVIFDAGGVLHPNTSTETLAEVQKELDLTPAEVVVFWDLVIQTLEIGTVTEGEFWQDVSDKLGKRLVSPKENLLGRVYDKRLAPREPIFELVRDLSAHGLKTAVLSNTIEPHANTQRTRGQFDPFDEVFLSNELHLRKPGTEIFEVALKKLGVAAEEAIFIDDRAANLDAPRELGIRSILYDTEDRLISEIHALALPVTKRGPWGSFTILVRPDGALLLQHRDDKPTIAAPNGITGWGGSGDPGESPLECALRELTEETNLRPTPNDLKFLGMYFAPKENRDAWVFELTGVDDQSLKIFEGQGFLVVKNLKDADSLPFTPTLRRVVGDYWGN